jgi:hypothetical protein
VVILIIIVIIIMNRSRYNGAKETCVFRLASVS